MKKQSMILGALIALSLVIRLFFATHDIDTLVKRCLADDAFYGFSIAKNIAGGLGSTFDGVTRTNGFPPLPMLILIPIFASFRQSLAAPVQASLIVMSIFDLMTGYLIYRILMRVSDWRGAIIGSAFWLLNPCFMLVTLTGCEAGFCVFFDALCLLLLIRFLSGDSPRARSLIALGIGAGLAILGRSDAIFLVLAVAIALAADRRVPPRRRMATLAIFGCLTAVTISPWIVWNLVNFGMAGPVSGLVKPFRSHNLYLQKYGTYFSTALLKQIGSWSYISLHIIATSVGLGAGLFAVIAIAAVAQILSDAARKKCMLTNPMVTALLFAAFMICFYSFYFWQTHPWYFHSTCMVFCLALGWAGSRWIGMLPRVLQKLWVPALVLLVAISAHRGKIHWRNGLFPWQGDYVTTARQLRRRFGDERRFAAFNAGIYKYFSEVPLLNVDASVNNEAYQAMRDRTLFNDYLKKREIHYLVDQEYVVKMYWSLYGPKAGMDAYLRPVVCIPVPWRFADSNTAANIVVYEVNRNLSE
jgi:hypothetical protein